MTLDLITLYIYSATAKHDDQETGWATGASRDDFPDITFVGPRLQDTDGSTTKLDLMDWLWKINFNMLGYFESDVDGNMVSQTIRAYGFEASSILIGPGQAPNPSMVGLPINIGDIAKVALFQNSSGLEYVHSSAISEALYGEVVYSLTNKLNQTLGYRRSEDTKGSVI